MTNTLSIKTQSKRSTKWHEKTAVNVNIFYPAARFEIGIVTSGRWGEFEEENPKVEISIEGNDYSIPLQKFKDLIKKHYK